MKEASGELNMTLITIIAIAAIAGLFFALKDPIMKAINDRWGQIRDTDTPIENKGNNITND